MIDFNFILKTRVHELCIELVKDKIKLIDNLYLSNQNALDSSTKSSAGDKHETSRAMIHLDQEKLSSQLLELNKSCLLYTSPSPRDATLSRMPSSA